MWKFGKHEEGDGAPAASVAPVGKMPKAVPEPLVAKPKETHSMETKPVQNYRPDVAHIGKSVIVKGELSGSEDLYLDGEVEGSIELNEHSLTVGPNGRIRANVRAQSIIVHGKVEGNIYGSERVELKKSAVLVGDIFTRRIAVEDGAYFKGAIDVQKGESKANAASAASAPVSGS